MTRLILLIILGFTVAVAFAFERRPQPYKLYSLMEWNGCQRSSCVPSFYPLPDGRTRLLRCDNGGYCYLFSYVYWTAENCNRLTACPDYKPHRGDVMAARKTVRSKVQ